MAEYFPIDVSSFGIYSGSFSGSFQGDGSKLTGVSASYFSGSISNATSASYALTASYAINGGGGGSTSPGGSNTQIQFNKTGAFGGDSRFTYNSASSALTLTGSFNVSGSTTQIGNNTLLGNTTLSGSVIISGALGQPNPTISVYGDLNQTGYTRYLPVTTNLDTSISASYIYVSGSTNDLYFSQFGSGYANTTRLRWLEGNLYTGLLSGGVLSTTPGTTTFNLSSGSGVIVTLNASTGSTDPYPTVQYLRWDNFTGQAVTNITTSKITYVSINSSGTINQSTTPIGYIDPTQWDNQIELGVILHLSGSVTTGVYNAPQVAYGQSQRTDDFIRAFGPVKVSGHTLQASGSSPTLSLKKTSGVSYNNGSNYIINPNHPSTVSDPAINVSKIYRYYISGSTPIIDTGVANAGYTAIDSKNYVDTTTGTLTAVGAGFFSIQRVFWIPNSPTNAFIVYYGNARYGNLVDATNAKDSEPFFEAPNTAQNAIFIGYIIIQGGGVGAIPRDLLNPNEATIIQGGLFRNIGGVGVSGTAPAASTLAGLSDVSVSTRATGDLLFYSGSLWYNTKTLSGSYTITGSLNVSGSITGSLFGTASWTTNSITSSYILNAVSASFATTASFVNPLRQTLQISGSTLLTGSLIVRDPATGFENFKVSGGLASYILKTGVTNAFSIGAGGTVIQAGQNSGFPYVILGDIDGVGNSTAITINDGSNPSINMYAPNNITIQGGTLNIQSILSATAGASISGGTLSATGGATISGGTLIARSGATITGSLLVTGSLTITGSSIISSQLIIGTSSAGGNENTIIVGPPPSPGVGEGGQILLQASGGLYTSASMLDNYQNKFRVLRGTNTSSDAFKMQIDMQTGQIQIPNYNSSTAFTGSAVAGLGVDSNGNIVSSPRLSRYGTALSGSTIGTGVTAQTIVYSQLIPANTFSAGNIFRTYFRFRKLATNANATYNILVNTTNAVAGATTLATLTANTVHNHMKRDFYIAQGNATSTVGSGVSLNTDDTSNTQTLSTITWSSDQYLIYTVTLNTLDSGYGLGYTIEQVI
jgi:hypothetical protein